MHKMIAKLDSYLPALPLYMIGAAFLAIQAVATWAILTGGTL